MWRAQAYGRRGCTALFEFHTPQQDQRSLGFCWLLPLVTMLTSLGTPPPPFLHLPPYFSTV